MLQLAQRKGLYSLFISVIIRGSIVWCWRMHGQLPSSFGLDVLGEPVHAFIEAVAAGCIRRLDLPPAVAQVHQTETLRDLRHC